MTIPNSVTLIEDKAFSGCSSLTSLTIPNSVTSIGSYAFSGCSGVEKLYYNAENCEGWSSSSPFPTTIKELTIGEDVKTIPTHAFYKCTGLTSVTIPNSVISIDSSAFSGCSGLTSVTIPNSVTSIGRFAFYECSSLISVSLPNSLTSIGNYAFSGCRSLTSLSLPNSLTSIGSYTFNNCALSKVEFSSSLTSIGDYAFNNCHLSEVVCPPNVETIGANAFSGNDLKKVIMGSKVTEIGANAFNGANNLESVSITALTPPSAQNSSFSYYRCPLYVMPSENDVVMDAYYNYPRCWYRFDGYDLTPISELNISGDSSIELYPGEMRKLEVSIYPSNASLPYIFWHSTNPEVATVDNNGVVTLVDHQDGIATYSDEPQTCQIIAESLYPDIPAAVFTIGDVVTGVDKIDSEFGNNPDNGTLKDIFSLQGICIKRNATPEDIKSLKPGLYIIGGKKIIIR